MNLYKTSAELKSMAKGQLIDKYSTVIAALLMTFCITSAITILAGNIIGTNTIWSVIANYISTFLIELIAGILATGLVRFYLNIACNQPHTINDVFYSFSHETNKAVILAFFKTLIGLVPFLPFYIASYIYTFQKNQTLFILSILLFILGLAVFIFLNLIFSQIYYLLIDLPSYTPVKLMHLSARLMKGNLARLFYLELSFIPLYLLSIISCGIGFLWVIPYSLATKANYYLDLMSVESRKQQSI